ncbi:MAG: tautomerase family protein [Anaerolineae bacterium]
MNQLWRPESLSQLQASWKEFFMPFTNISLKKGKPLEYRRTLMEQVYLSMRETIAIPENDRFATITELEIGNFNSSGDYAGIGRTDEVVFIQITLNAGRTIEQKKSLYAEIAKRLKADPGVRPEDIVISLLEVASEDWSLGNGVAQYA